MSYKPISHNPVPGRTLAAQIMVIAKEPVPGRVKTRLTPPYTPAEAAELAEAALADTLAAVASAGVTRRVLALAGTPGRWLPAASTSSVSGAAASMSASPGPWPTRGRPAPPPWC